MGWAAGAGEDGGGELAAPLLSKSGGGGAPRAPPGRWHIRSEALTIRGAGFAEAQLQATSAVLSRSTAMRARWIDSTSPASKSGSPH